MKVGMVGLGKLGYPVAIAMASKGHTVYGTDVVKDLNCVRDYWEDSQNWINIAQGIICCDLDRLVSSSEIIFVAVQTPHGLQHDGTAAELPEEPADFDYAFLVEATQEACEAATRNQARPLIVIISTVLPGTIREKILPVINHHKLDLIYNPSFIAMGSVIKNWLNPWAVLIGRDEGSDGAVAENTLGNFYLESTKAPFLFSYTYEEAELAKVAFNTMPAFKIALASAVQEVADHFGSRINAGRVMRFIDRGDREWLQGKYLTPGLGDGGPCHPRDNFALMYLRDSIGIYQDPWRPLMWNRQKHAEWITDGIAQICEKYALKPAILGRAYKPGVELTDGSCAVLIENMLIERGYEPTSPDLHDYDDVPKCFLVGTRDSKWNDYPFPEGSVVVDPHGIVLKKPEAKIEVIHLGRRP